MMRQRGFESNLTPTANFNGCSREPAPVFRDRIATARQEHTGTGNYALRRQTPVSSNARLPCHLQAGRFACIRRCSGT